MHRSVELGNKGDTEEITKDLIRSHEAMLGDLRGKLDLADFR